MMRVHALAAACARRAPARGYSVLADAPSPVTYTRKGPQPAAAPPAVKTVSKAASGVTVATYDHLGPQSSLAIVVNAGSRFESADAPGVAHLLKASLVRTPENDTVTRLIQEAELRGNTLYSAVSREHLVLASDFLRDDLVDVVPTLVSQVFNRSFHPYEFLDAAALTEQQTAVSLEDPATHLFEKLHQVAFRTGLGNSLFASHDALHALDRAKLQAFADKHFTADRITVVGSGVSHTELKALVDAAFADVKLSSAKAETARSRYFGGEARIDAGPHSEAHYAVTFPGVAYGSPEYNTSLVVRALLDGSKRVKWGSRGGALGLLSAAATENTTSQAVSISYSDAGLIGFHVAGKGGDVKQVVSKSLESLRSLASGVSAEALAGAKKAAIIAAEEAATRAGLVDSVGRGAAATGAFHASADVLAINNVTASDVQKLVQGALAAKPSVVALGGATLPYADEL
ncbi:ubiquinol-cytochrome c reductase core subunit 1 [Polyrhizophydium stewartii]|uniref:Cytochrome b-c1 complex subunit 2, mitochondrial n=1 Tax=Polyrhizophydium stewartii TaxID=2732419 RepID=A0ABR4N2H2_9FUNG